MPMRFGEAVLKVGIVGGCGLGSLPGGVAGLAGFRNSLQGILLLLGTGPLSETGAIVPTSIPGAGLDADLAVGAVIAEVIVDECRAHFSLAAADGIEERLIKNAPEIPFL